MFRTQHTKKGFTALELLMVIAIVAILFVIVVSSFFAFRSKSALNSETEEVVTLLNKARLSSMSSLGDQQYGVHFQSDRIVLFQGTTYSAGASSNDTHTFDSLVTMSGITVSGGGSDVVFKKVTGEATKSATTTISVVSNSTASSTIVVRTTGVVSVQ